MNTILLQVRDVKKHYFERGKLIKEALRGVTLDIYQGEIFGLLGVNGAGKTTLSSIIATLHPLTAGKVLYNGKSIYDDLIEYRRQLGFCPQKPNLNPLLTLEQNLIFAGRFYGMSEQEIRIQVDRLMDQFELKPYARQQMHVLSGGYKQRFLIARAMLHSPKLIILDEPTVALDPHVRHQLWDMIRGLKQQGVTVLLTTHYLDEAEALSDRVCILDQGLIKLIDTPQNLKKDFQQANLEAVFLRLMKEQNQ